MVIVANKLVYFLALCLGDFLLKFFKRTLPELLMRLSLHHHPVQKINAVNQFLCQRTDEKFLFDEEIDLLKKLFED